MSHKFETDQNVSPFQEAELTPLEKARQKIVEHLRNAKRGDPRLEAFHDYVEFRKLEITDPIDPDEIQFAINRKIINRMSEVEGYRRAYQELKVVEDYWRVLRDISSNQEDRKLKFVQGLQEIKEEIERKNQASIPPQE
jgi:hypothetical protein